MLVVKIIYKKVMLKDEKKINVILCGGGTGGHIFPMIAIADELKRRNKQNNILFVGSKDRMEMEIVPKYNYQIIGLWISGIKRSSMILNILLLGMPFIFKNIFLPFKILFSIIQSIFILLKYRPDMVIGFGGYSSGPFLFISSMLKYKTAIQEQNSYPGLTNKILSNRVDMIFIAYDNIKKYISNKSIFNYGNPLRKMNFNSDQKNSYDYFKLDKNKKTILVLGGSLGAKSINDGILNNLSLIRESSFQILWQTGKYYYEEINSNDPGINNLIIKPFIKRMDIAYKVADIIISRAGAIAISELCIIGKPSILIPSPNVVDDHQTKNASEIQEKGGCVMIKDTDCKDLMMNEAISLISNNKKMNLMKDSLKKLGKPFASKNIVDKIYKSIS